MRFAVWSAAAERIWVCCFDSENDHEIARVPLGPSPDGTHTGTVRGAAVGTRYGLRADGPYAPARGDQFDPAKLLVDPYATQIDRPFVYDPRLGAPRASAIDTAPLMPKAIVAEAGAALPPQPPVFKPGGLIYEVPVKPFTWLHPDIPERLRGTVAALAHPAIIAHLHRIGADAVELMPITAWIDERHLHALGLSNGWGYNPVAMMALDPRLCPGGIGELRRTVAILRAAGIGVILDVVFNHTGESDASGPTLSLRGLDNRAYFRHDPDGGLINDTGTGNTLDCAHPATRRLILDAMRHFVGHGGIDGFRFDLAPVMGRTRQGFDPGAPLLHDIVTEPLLKDRILIAEPWDVGPGGYQLGRFPAPFLEWNDRARDSIRRFWRGDAEATRDFATALAGSSDVFAAPVTRTVNFIAAHDGFTLADLVTYRHKQNAANGERNRDGHDENLSWNNGAEGASAHPGVLAARAHDRRALLATLVASRGTIMLTAGDEFGHSQSGNNNAYAQDNATTWLDWSKRDRMLEDYFAGLVVLRRAHPEMGGPGLRTSTTSPLPDAAWLSCDGTPMTEANWLEAGTRALAMMLARTNGTRLAVLFNRSTAPERFQLPVRSGYFWPNARDGTITVSPRSVTFVREHATH